MLTPSEREELLGIEAMAKMLMEKAKAFRLKSAPEEGEIRKRKPTKKEQVRQFAENQFAKHREKMMKKYLQNQK
jgi:hypothetical protein